MEDLQDMFIVHTVEEVQVGSPRLRCSRKTVAALS